MFIALKRSSSHAQPCRAPNSEKNRFEVPFDTLSHIHFNKLVIPVDAKCVHFLVG
jgi:hypothetical protein